VNISSNLPEDGFLDVDVFDLNGKKVADLFSSFVTAGERILAWTPGGGVGQDLPARTYILQLKFRGDILTRKLVLAGL
jgi:hypothetical protein